MLFFYCYVTTLPKDNLWEIILPEKNRPVFFLPWTLLCPVDQPRRAAHLRNSRVRCVNITGITKWWTSPCCRCARDNFVRFTPGIRKPKRGKRVNSYYLLYFNACTRPFLAFRARALTRSSCRPSPNFKRKSVHRPWTFSMRTRHFHETSYVRLVSV